MFDVNTLLQTGGILAVSLIVFAESGLLFGFVLPGDTLLFSAGVFAAQGKIHLPMLLFGILAGAIIGDNVGYSVGRRLGPRIFKKKDGILFRAEYIEKSEIFFEKHGGKTITFARFVPVVRTFAPMVAGAAKMPRHIFMAYNVVGAVIWGVGLTLLGYFSANLIPNVEQYVAPAMILAVIATFAPSAYHIFKDPKARGIIVQKIKSTASRIGLNKKL